MAEMEEMGGGGGGGDMQGVVMMVSDRDTIRANKSTNRLMSKFRSHAREVGKKAIKSRESTYEEVSKVVRFGYGLPQFAMLPLTLIISIYGTTYYEAMGASLPFIAFFTALARSFDVMTDPLMGWISDNTRSRWGRRRPYMAVFSIFFSISFVLLMAPPMSKPGENKTSYWFGIFYITFYIWDTIANVPYGALGPELTSDSDTRTTIFFFAKLYSGLGTLAGATSPEMVRQFISWYYNVNPDDNDINIMRSSFIIVSSFFAVVYFISMQFVVYNIKEREMSSETDAMPLVPSILRSFKNQAFRPLLGGWIFDAIALSSLASMFPFFITYVIAPDPDKGQLSDKVTAAACFAALFIAAILAMPVWKLLAAKFGRYHTWLFYNLFNSCSNFLYAFVNRGDPLYTIGITAINGIPVGGQFLIDSILADVIDYDEFLNGTRNEGGFTVFATFIPKFVSVPAGALPFSLLAMIGFVPSVDGVPQEQPEAVINFIRFVFVVIPCLCTLSAFFIKRHYPLKKEEQVQMINAGVERHLNGLPAIDPITKEYLEILVLSKPEQEQAWVLDNFSHTQLKGLVEKKNTKHIVNEFILYFVGGIVAFAIFLTLTIVFFDDIEDPALSLIPIVSVVTCGMLMCFIIVTSLRLKAAYSLRGEKLNMELVEKIIEHKEKGARGGDALESDEELDRANQLIASLSERLEAAQREIIRLRIAVNEPYDDIIAEKEEFGVEADLLRRDERRLSVADVADLAQNPVIEVTPPTGEGSELLSPMGNFEVVVEVDPDLAGADDELDAHENVSAAAATPAPEPETPSSPTADAGLVEEAAPDPVAEPEEADESSESSGPPPEDAIM